MNFNGRKSTQHNRWVNPDIDGHLLSDNEIRPWISGPEIEKVDADLANALYGLEHNGTLAKPYLSTLGHSNIDTTPPDLASLKELLSNTNWKYEDYDNNDRRRSTQSNNLRNLSKELGLNDYDNPGLVDQGLLRFVDNIYNEKKKVRHNNGSRGLQQRPKSRSAADRKNVVNPYPTSQDNCEPDHDIRQHSSSYKAENSKKRLESKVAQKIKAANSSNRIHEPTVSSIRHSKGRKTSTSSSQNYDMNHGKTSASGIETNSAINNLRLKATITKFLKEELSIGSAKESVDKRSPKLSPEDNFQDYLRTYHSKHVQDDIPGKPKRPSSAPNRYQKRSGESSRWRLDENSKTNTSKDLNTNNNDVEDLSGDESDRETSASFIETRPLTASKNHNKKSHDNQTNDNASTTNTNLRSREISREGALPLMNNRPESAPTSSGQPDTRMNVDIPIRPTSSSRSHLSHSPSAYKVGQGYIFGGSFSRQGRTHVDRDLLYDNLSTSTLEKLSIQGSEAKLDQESARRQSSSNKSAYVDVSSNDSIKNAALFLSRRAKNMRSLREHYMTSSGVHDILNHPEIDEIVNKNEELKNFSKYVTSQVREKNRADNLWNVLQTPGYIESVGPQNAFKSETRNSFTAKSVEVRLLLSIN